MNSDMYPAALDVANKLRAAGQSVDLVLQPKKTKWVFKHSDRIGAKYCAIIGSQEYENGEVSIKDLALGEQSNISVDSLEEWVAGLSDNQ